MSYTGYIKELEDSLQKAELKVNFYEKHFKNLVCHHGYSEGNYCQRVVKGFSSLAMRYCWFCKLPFCSFDGHLTTCQRCFHASCQKCLQTHNCCDHTNLPDEWIDGCDNCHNPVCGECIDDHECG